MSNVGDAKTETAYGVLDRSLKYLAVPAAILMSAYHLVVAVIGPPITEAHRPLHFMMGVAILFCLGGLNQRPRTLLASIVDVAFLLMIIVPSSYLVMNAEAVSGRMLYVDPLTPLQIVLACMIFLATLEATRRALGWPMVIIAVVFLVYTQIGPYLPYPLWHRGYPLPEIAEQMFLTLDGLWGVPLGASANYIFLFVLFGALMVASGAGAFFSDFANVVAGRFVGGPAKTAVFSSALMSMLSGSSTANVVTTGSFTIPAMKRYGYRPEFAASVEAVASTGGLITPPVMGAAAFIMADFLGVSYIDIMYAAAIPAVLYFLAIFIAVDLEARRVGLKVDSDVAGTPLGTLLKGLYLLVPLGVMIWFLLAGYTPASAAFWGIVSFVATLPLLARKGPKELGRILLDAAIEAPRMMVPVIVACAVGGAVAGMISITGLGVRVTSIIAAAAGDSSLLFLLFTMVIAIILGMGMPTSAVYIVLAAILAPGLIDLGFPPLAAHMFIFFGAVMSNITPPLAMASFAAAAVAGSDPWKTSISAVRLAVGVFIIPFIFIYSPELIGQGEPLVVLHAAATAAIGIFALSVASVGWLRRPIAGWLRLVIAGGAVALIVPGTMTDVVGLAVVILLFVLLFSGRSTIAES